VGKPVSWPAQVPSEAQVSFVVQERPSSHDVPGVGICTHPLVGLQVSEVQELLSLQLRGVPPTHVGAPQAGPTQSIAVPPSH